MWNVTVPLGLLADATVVIESRFCLLRSLELPTRSSTCAPGWELNVTVTVEYLTGWPMSIMSPEPDLSWPNSGLAYHWELQPVCMLPSMAYLASWLSSLVGSADGLVSGSKP